MLLTFENIKGSGETYLDVMRAICGDVSEKSMVDLGCFHSPYVPKLGFKERTYVDIQDRGLDDKNEQQFFVQSDVFEFLSQCPSYDVSIASDMIEHLSRYDGQLLISMIMAASKKQIIFTPLGEYAVTGDKHPDSHQSGWMPEDFNGWASIVFPNFHPTLEVGAFFSWRCENIEQDFERVKTILKDKLWTK